MADYNLGKAEGTISIKYVGDGIPAAKKDMDGLDDRSKSTGAALTKLGATSGVAGLALAAGIGYAAKVAIDFEHQISAIGAVSNATQGELDLLRKKALQLGADTSFSATQAGLAMEELVKAGLSVTEVLNGAADATVALAAAGGIDLPQAATIAANAMNAFGLSARDLAHVTDLIAGAANASAIDVGQFGFALQQSGAVANLAGVSFDDLTTAIALLGNAGIAGSDAGTSLKTALSNLQPTTKKQIELTKALGIVTAEGNNRFYDAAGNLKSLSEVSQILQDSMKGLTAAQQAQSLETIFGSDAIRAAAILTKAGSKGFDEMAASIGKVKAADVAAARLDNVSGAIEQLKGSAETAAIAFGTALLPVIKTVANFLKDLADKFTNLSPGMQKVIVIAVVVAAALLGIIAAVAIVAAAFTAIGTAVAAGILPIIGIILAVVAVLAGLAIIGYQIYKNWDDITGVIKDVGHWFAELGKTVGGAVTDAFDKVAGAAKAVWEGLVDGASAVGRALTKAWEVISPPFIAAFNLIRSVVELVFAIISAVIAVWLAGTKASWALLDEYIVQPTIKFFAMIFKTISDVMLAVKSTISDRWDEIVVVFNAIRALLEPPITATFNAIQLVIDTVMGSVKDTINTAWEIIKRIWTDAVDRVVFVTNGISKVLDKFTQFFKDLKKAADDGIGPLIQFFLDLPPKIISAIKGLGTDLYNAGRSIINGFLDGLKSAWGSVGTWLTNRLSDLRDLLPFSPAKEGPFSGRGWTRYSGEALVGDFAEGIKRSTASAQAAMAGMVNGVSGVIPTDYSAVVSGAVTATGLTAVSAASLSAQANQQASRTLTVGAINLNGVWDFTDPTVARKIVSTIHGALSDYEREYS